MLLGDLGAEVTRVERPVEAEVIPGVTSESDVLLRGRTVVRADLKVPAERDRVLDLIAGADVLVEGYRPGAAERMGLGPEDCAARNPGLVYARMTGWGQSGPRAHTAGHDINYIALTGVLDNIGPAGGDPIPPLNLVGDFGGGSMFLVVGVLAALHERTRTGRGGVVDGAIVDGVGALAQMQWSMRGQGRWSTGRGNNVLDGSAPFYRTYRCADGAHVAVGCIESRFFRTMLDGLGIDPGSLPPQWDRPRWPEIASALETAFAAAPREHWAELFRDTDACVTPVLTYDEALGDEHLVARGAFVRTPVDAAAPAPRFA
ncbi:Alpha-methylacyl-CoA racemase [Tsukamurella ocularis]